MRKIWIVMLVTVMLTALGCANQNQSVHETASTAANASSSTGLGTDLPPAEQNELTLRLNWKFKGEFAPFFVAKEKGIFEKYGLNVNVLEGSGSVSVLQVIAQNKEEIGVTSAVEPVQGIEKGMPVKMIASYMTRSPIILLSYPDNPVRSPKDLEGKSLASSSGSTFTSVYEKFLEYNGTDYEKVEHMMVETGARNTLFQNREADAIAVFSTNEYPLFEKNLGQELVPLYLADYGFDLSGLSLITNNKFAEENPNTLKRFLIAVDEAFAYSMEHPEEAAAISKRLFPDVVDEQITAEQIVRTGELAVRPEGKPYGYVNAEHLEQMTLLMQETGLIKNREKVDTYYTNQYLPDQSAEAGGED
ncbi:ABC transporter substrate-binding protein [Paenibacillus urinalis]|uniref:ABC transporter substrate-binding protein n=1 Tax=Paenibacillus urinalis TaxID=521520 RepID=A0AAX3MYE2_9BACL|nr:ABC transporter substrate-binding protein [Paenibacillus urinalis]WDH81389.1 ABC transporter substrate-binding protein [Paenibacillus urinalis]